MNSRFFIADVRNVVRLLVIVFAAGFLLGMCAGCQQTPQYRLPGPKVGYRLPPCSPTLTPGVPCAQPVKDMTRSECEKLFGYRRCRALFVYGKPL